MRINDDAESVKELVLSAYTFNEKTGLFTNKDRLFTSKDKKLARKLILPSKSGNKTCILIGVAAWVIHYGYLPSWTLRREKVFRHDESKGFTKDNIYMEKCAVMKRKKEFKPIKHDLKSIQKNQWMCFVSRPFMTASDNERT